MVYGVIAYLQQEINNEICRCRIGVCGHGHS